MDSTQTTTSRSDSEVCDIQVLFIRKNAHKNLQVAVLAGCWAAVVLSVLSLCCHDHVGQEPGAGDHSTVDEFWKLW